MASYGNVAPVNRSNPNNDVEVASVDDSISSLAWCPIADYLAAGLWSNKLGLWQIDRQSGCQQKHVVQHEGPVLCTSWSPDGTKVFSGSCDKSAKMTDLQTMQTTVVAQHDAPVSCMRTFNNGSSSMLLTGSWDKTIKYWDLRQSNPALVVPMPDRVYTMDVVYPVLVVTTADPKPVYVFSMTAPQQPVHRAESLLKYPVRCIGAYPNKGGFVSGSVEGRVAIQNFEEPKEENAKSFSYKCHREPDKSNDCYSVNAVSFHTSKNLPNVYATVGSDGWYSFWDKDARSRLFRPTMRQEAPITAGSFNADGTLFAYSVCYDWSKGHAGNTLNKNLIFVKVVTEDNLRKRPSAK